MKIQFLGTRAADYGKDTFAEIPDRFDKDNRRASAALVNGHILLDAGPHVLDSLRIAGHTLSQITDILITHQHSDHMNPSNILAIASVNPALRIWIRAGEGWKAAKNKLPGLQIMPTEFHHRYQVEEDLFVTGLPANHNQDAYPQHLLIEGEGKTLFYGPDGGWLMQPTFDALRERKLDLMVLDCTCGDYVGDYRMSVHNSIPMIRLMLPSLRTVGAIDGHTRVIISHLAVTLHASHEETQAICARDGIEVAYDGWMVEI